MTRSIPSKFAIFFVALVVFALGASAVDAPAQGRKEKRESEKRVDEGDKAAAQKNFQAAIASYVKAIESWPGNPRAHYMKARAHLSLSEFDKAATEFDLALKNGQKPMEVYRFRWLVYEKLKQYDLALADIDSLMKAEPSNGDYPLAVAEINFDRGNYEAASAAYQKALLRAPNNAELYYKLAVCRSKVGDIDGTAAAAEEAVKRNTLFRADALVLLGGARHAQKRIPEAIDAYAQALASRQDKLEAYRQLAELYRSQNRLDEAIDISKAGLRIYPNNGEIFTDLSWFYSLAGRTDDAIAAGRSAVQLLPKAAIGYTNLCRAYNDAKKSELAISTCNSALRLSPEDGETLFYIGRAYDELKNRAEAEKFYRRAVTGLIEFTKANPDYSDGYYLLGNAYAEVGQNGKAIEAYKKCLDLNPRFSKANFNIGIIQIIEKNKAGAIEQYNALLLTDKVLAEKLKAEIDKL